MSITFNCEHCGNEIKAPDTAGGKRGKCPYCQQSNYIPLPVSEEDIIPFAEEEEQAAPQHEYMADLLRQEKELLAETGGKPETPLEHREQVAAKDLYHFVVNYCLDLSSGKLDRAATYVPKLKKFGSPGKQAVEDFISGRTIEPALSAIPGRVLAGFLTDLRDKLK